MAYCCSSSLSFATSRRTLRVNSCTHPQHTTACQRTSKEVSAYPHHLFSGANAQTTDSPALLVHLLLTCATHCSRATPCPQPLTQPGADSLAGNLAQHTHTYTAAHPSSQPLPHLAPYRQWLKQVPEGHSGAHSARDRRAGGQHPVAVVLQARGCCLLCCACDDAQLAQGSQGAEGLASEAKGVQRLRSVCGRGVGGVGGGRWVWLQDRGMMCCRCCCCCSCSCHACACPSPFSSLLRLAAESLLLPVLLLLLLLVPPSESPPGLETG